VLIVAVIGVASWLVLRRKRRMKRLQSGIAN